MGRSRALRISGRRFRLRGFTASARQVVDALVAVTLAPRCAACARVLDSPLDGAVCGSCWAAARLSLGQYDGALRDIIHAFKYEGRRSLAPPLGAMLRDAGVDVLRDAACVVPVPLHPWKRLRRGFNQAADLSRQVGLPVVHALWRARVTMSQAGLTAAGRQRNVRGAFRVSPLLSRTTRERFIDDRIVVLIDDVKTTGATLEACSEILMDAGVREVRTLTLARAELHHR